MKKYIDQAIKTLNFNSPLIQSSNSRYLINRITEIAFSRFVEQERVQVSAIQCDDRAIHYAKKIGDTVEFKGKRSNYSVQELARAKSIIKHVVSIQYKSGKLERVQCL